MVISEKYPLLLVKILSFVSDKKVYFPLTERSFSGTQTSTLGDFIRYFYVKIHAF